MAAVVGTFGGVEVVGEVSRVTVLAERTCVSVDFGADRMDAQKDQLFEGGRFVGFFDRLEEMGNDWVVK
jgi:hypothetical protein